MGVSSSGIRVSCRKSCGTPLIDDVKTCSSVKVPYRCWTRQVIQTENKCTSMTTINGCA